MKKTKVLWSKILEELERTPVIQVVCEKFGISRQTFYRWMNESEDSFNDVNKALGFGVGLVNDVAESNVLTGIKNKDPGYTKYWLSHRHEAYKKPFRHRDASNDEFERKRIETHYQNKRKMEENLNRKSKEEIDIAVQKARAMLDKWIPPKDDPKAT
jgi:hypothetical protein